jgi:hypothetical protein
MKSYEITNEITGDCITYYFFLKIALLGAISEPHHARSHWNVATATAPLTQSWTTNSKDCPWLNALRTAEASQFQEICSDVYIRIYIGASRIPT